jgi:hypothetical protein
MPDGTGYANLSNEHILEYPLWTGKNAPGRNRLCRPQIPRNDPENRAKRLVTAKAKIKNFNIFSSVC